MKQEDLKGTQSVFILAKTLVYYLFELNGYLQAQQTMSSTHSLRQCGYLHSDCPAASQRACCLIKPFLAIGKLDRESPPHFLKQNRSEGLSS